jgi:hypothetical protein
LLFLDVKHDANREANVAYGVAFRSHAEVIELRPQRESSAGVQAKVNARAGGKGKRVRGVGEG